MIAPLALLACDSWKDPGNPSSEAAPREASGSAGSSTDFDEFSLSFGFSYAFDPIEVWCRRCGWTG